MAGQTNQTWAGYRVVPIALLSATPPELLGLLASLWLRARLYSHNTATRGTIKPGEVDLHLTELATSLRAAPDRNGALRVRRALQQLSSAGLIEFSTQRDDNGHNYTLVTITDFVKLSDPRSYSSKPSKQSDSSSCGYCNGTGRYQGQACVCRN